MMQSKKTLSHLFVFDLSKEILIEAARLAARYESFSYRSFKVGCAVLAYNGNRHRVFLGANMKPRKHGQKICAEQMALKNAFAAEYTEIVAIVVAGKPQKDHENGETPLTLHPCRECRTVLQSLPQVSPDTIVYTVTLKENGSEELHKFQELLDRYQITTA